jgi:hypothetical protein
MQDKERPTDSICQTKRTGRLHAAVHIFDLCPGVTRQPQPLVYPAKILHREHLVARDDALARKLVHGLHPGHRDQHLQCTLAEAEPERLNDVLLNLGLEDDVDVALPDE